MKYSLANLPDHLNQDPALMEEVIDDASPTWLERLSIQFGVSKAVKERRAREGDFLLGSKNLDEEFKIVPILFRYHADVWENGQQTKETFDTKSALWAEIAKLAKRKSTKELSAKAGPELFAYVPSVKKFCTLRFARSSLKSAQAFHEVLGKVITLSTVRVGKMDTPVPCVKAVHEGATYDAPEEEYAQAMLEKFVEPTIEATGDAAGER